MKLRIVGAPKLKIVDARIKDVPRSTEKAYKLPIRPSHCISKQSPVYVKYTPWTNPKKCNLNQKRPIPCVCLMNGSCNIKIRDKFIYKRKIIKKRQNLWYFSFYLILFTPNHSSIQYKWTASCTTVSRDIEI